MSQAKPRWYVEQSENGERKYQTIFFTTKYGAQQHCAAFMAMFPNGRCDYYRNETDAEYNARARKAALKRNGGI